MTTQQDNHSNVTILIYQGGRCGEFLHSLLTHHVGNKNKPNDARFLDWDSGLNRYRVHDKEFPFLFNNWLAKGIRPTAEQFKLKPGLNHILRSHCAVPYEEVFPGVKTVLVHSENYNNFFSTLYWIKHLLQPSRDSATAWEDIVASEKFKAKNGEVITVHQFLDNSIKQHTAHPNNINNWYNPVPLMQYAKSNYSNCFYLNIDQLFFDNNQQIYQELCDFLGIKSSYDAWLRIQDYHKRNIELLKKFNVHPKKDHSGNDLYEQIKINVLKVLNHPDFKKITANPQPHSFSFLRLSPLTVVQYTAGRGGEFLSRYISTHSGYVPLETEFNKDFNYYRVKDVIREQLNRSPDWKNVLTKTLQQDKQKRVTSTFFSDDNHVKLAGWFKTELIDEGALTVLPISQKYNALYSALAFIKYWFVKISLAEGWHKYVSLMPKHQLSKLEFEDNFKQDQVCYIWQVYSLAFFQQILPVEQWYSDTGLTLKEQQSNKIISRLNGTYTLDLDALYFDKNYDAYYNMCDFLGVEPRSDHVSVFEDYHLNNIRLVADLDITTEDEDYFKNWVLKYYEQLTK